MDEDNIYTAPNESIVPKCPAIGMPGGDDPIEGEASVDQINVEMPLINLNRFIFRMSNNSKIITRFDVTNMQR